LLVLVVMVVTPTCSAFVPTGPYRQHHHRPFRVVAAKPSSSLATATTSTSTSLNGVMTTFLSESITATAATSNWIATIDADIANIPDNEFAPIFLGGVLVMFGGVLSATILGFILEKGDLYANVVADSYLQQDNDEEFWKGLSEEERIQGKEILKQLEAKNNGKMGRLSTSEMDSGKPQDETGSMPPLQAPKQMAGTGSKKEMDIFSDYE
jgi:hypothetical protein